jgi:2-dehydropantoate 2-reductase
MRFCIVGAGAIGGFVGARLALGGEDVTFIARWKNLDAIRANGFKLFYKDGREEIATNVKAYDRFEEAGKHDVIILALKAHQVASVADKLGPLLKDDAAIITMQNGIPFWYFHGHGGELAGRAVESVDPGGAVLKAIARERIIGCVVYPATELTSPGTVVVIEGDRFPLGELDGSKSERVQKISEAFVRGGLKSPILENIRSEIWLKLWGNLSFNPVSALTHSTLSDICQDPNGRELVASMMREAQAVAEKLGITFRVTLDKRIEGAEKVGKHKTSMLQDVEAGRALEVDALVGSVCELGRLTGIPTPTISAVYNATKLLDKTMATEMIAVRGIQMPSS